MLNACLYTVETHRSNILQKLNCIGTLKPILAKSGQRRDLVMLRYLISFSNINKQYGWQLISADASFQLNPGEKVGLAGPNGAGKTTSFRMVVGEALTTSPSLLTTIGYFRQDVEEMQGRSVLDEAIAGSGRVGDLHHELESLQHAMEDPAPGHHGHHPSPASATCRNSTSISTAMPKQACGRRVRLGFKDDQIDGDEHCLGGWKMRVALARVLTWPARRPVDGRTPPTISTSNRSSGSNSSSNRTPARCPRLRTTASS